MTKKECETALSKLWDNTFGTDCITGEDLDKYVDVIDGLIQYVFNPQPYEYEDLKPGMWLWDKEIGACMYVKEIKGKEIVLLGGESFIVEIVNINDEFEEGRFFPVTKGLEYQR